MAPSSSFGVWGKKRVMGRGAAKGTREMPRRRPSVLERQQLAAGTRDGFRSLRRCIQRVNPEAMVNSLMRKAIRTGDATSGHPCGTHVMGALRSSAISTGGRRTASLCRAQLRTAGHRCRRPKHPVGMVPGPRRVLQLPPGHGSSHHNLGGCRAHKIGHAHAESGPPHGESRR
jgi:hypothetical protein